VPKTLVADVVVPEVFNPYVIQRTAELSALYQSGIVARNPELDRLAEAGGRLINMPYWEDLTGDDQVLSDVAALNVRKIEAARDVAALLARGNAWSVNDLAKALSGDDPMRAIGDLVAEYWARRMQVALISILDGVFAAPTMATNLHTVAAPISADHTIDALQLLGDAKDRLTGFGMHSATEAYLNKQDLIDFIPDSEGRVAMKTYLQKPVIIDDGCPFDPATGLYTSYIFGAGAIGWGEGGAPVPTETARDALASDDILIHRRHFLLHPRGVRWLNVNVAGEAPDNTELSDGDNWQRAYESKNIRIVRFNHEIG